MVTFPARLTSITDEANRIAPGRRKSSDGMLGDAAHRASGGDHNPDAAGVVHAVDISQSMPGTPYWEPQFGQFDVHQKQRDIAAEYIAAAESVRSARWPWLHDTGGYMVGFDGRVDVIFDPTVSLGWRQNGSAKTEHNQHGHFSIAHNARSENDTQPIFGTTTEEDMTTEAEVRKIVDEIVHEYAIKINQNTRTIVDQAVQRIGNYFPPKP